MTIEIALRISRARAFFIVLNNDRLVINLGSARFDSCDSLCLRSQIVINAEKYVEIFSSRGTGLLEDGAGRDDTA